MADLQSNVVVDNVHKKITGTLKYVTGYTGFSGDPEEQEGNYLVTHWTATNGSTITSQLKPKPRVVTLDPSDNILISRITDPQTQIIEMIATLNGNSSVTDWDLSGLVLEEGE